MIEILEIRTKLYILGYKSASRQRSFLYRSVTMWNSLPTAITDCNNLVMFKRKLKDYLFRLYFSNSELYHYMMIAIYSQIRTERPFIVDKI